MKIYKTNLMSDDSVQKQRGWFIGNFAKEPFDSNDFEIKWWKHKKGEKKDHPGYNKEAKSMSILVSGKFKVSFPTLKEEFILSEMADCVFYDKGVPHSWEAIEDCTVMSVRWPSIQDDQVLI